MRRKKKSKKKKIKVLYVGNFDLEKYTRGRVLYKGLLRNNIDVELVLETNVKGYINIVKRILKKDYDIILTTGKPVVVIALLMRWIHRRKVVFDAFISDYENLVLNRKLVKKNTLKAKIIWLIDKYSCKFSDNVIIDTIFHRSYFSKTFNISKTKFEIIFIGADDELFYPKNNRLNKESKNFKVVFYGSFLPGHGIDVILRAAKLLEKENIVFDFIGTGPLFKEMNSLSKKLNNRNVNFLGWVKYNKLPQVLSKYDICLGLFDNNISKVKRVIPTKVFEILAMKKPIITGKNKTMSFYFKNNEDLILSKMGSHEDLCDNILKLYKDKKLRTYIGEKGWLLFKKKFTTKSIGIRLKKVIYS